MVFKVLFIDPSWFRLNQWQHLTLIQRSPRNDAHTCTSLRRAQTIERIKHNLHQKTIKDISFHSKRSKIQQLILGSRKYHIKNFLRHASRLYGDCASFVYCSTTRSRCSNCIFLHQKQRTKNTTQGRGFLSLVARTKPNHLNAVTDPAPRPTSQFWKRASTAAAFVRTPWWVHQGISDAVMATIPHIISTSRSLPQGSWRWPNFLGGSSLRCSDIPAQLVSALIQNPGS